MADLNGQQKDAVYKNLTTFSGVTNAYLPTIPTPWPWEPHYMRSATNDLLATQGTFVRLSSGSVGKERT